MNQTGMVIAANAISSGLPEGTLEERIRAAAEIAKDPKRQSDVFWMMGGHLGDDTLFRTAIAAVMLTANDEEKEQIERSLKPLRSLSALLSGVPVDLEAIETSDIIPLMGIWHSVES